MSFWCWLELAMGVGAPVAFYCVGWYYLIGNLFFSVNIRCHNLIQFIVQKYKIDEILCFLSG